MPWISFSLSPNNKNAAYLKSHSALPKFPHFRLSEIPPSTLSPTPRNLCSYFAPQTFISSRYPLWPLLSCSLKVFSMEIELKWDLWFAPSRNDSATKWKSNDFSHIASKRKKAVNLFRRFRKLVSRLVDFPRKVLNSHDEVLSLPQIVFLNSHSIPGDVLTAPKGLTPCHMKMNYS